MRKYLPHQALLLAVVYCSKYMIKYLFVLNGTEMCSSIFDVCTYLKYVCKFTNYYMKYSHEYVIIRLYVVTNFILEVIHIFKQ